MVNLLTANADNAELLSSYFLKANSSGGPDGLPASFFKVTSDSIA